MVRISKNAATLRAERQHGTNVFLRHQDRGGNDGLADLLHAREVRQLRRILDLGDVAIARQHLIDDGRCRGHERRPYPRPGLDPAGRPPACRNRGAQARRARGARCHALRHTRAVRNVHRRDSAVAHQARCVRRVGRESRNGGISWRVAPSSATEPHARGAGRRTRRRMRADVNGFLRVSTDTTDIASRVFPRCHAVVRVVRTRYFSSAGQVAEWLKAPVSKTGIPVNPVSRVRISPCPSYPERGRGSAFALISFLCFTVGKQQDISSWTGGRAV